MNFSRSQKELVALGRQPVDGFDAAVVRVTTSYSGLTTAIRQAARESVMDHARPLGFRLVAVTPWDIVQTLAKNAKTNYLGRGHVTVYHDALKQIAERNSGRAIVLWLDAAGRLRPKEQDDLRIRMEWAAEHAQVSLRLIYLVQKTAVWNDAEQVWKRKWVMSERLCKAATCMDFGAEGFNETDTRELKEDEHVLMSQAG